MNKTNHIVEPEELMAYLDGELPAEQALDVAEHLERCRECQQLAARLKDVSEMLVAWQVEEPEDNPSDQIEKALDGGPSDKPKRDNRDIWRVLLNPLLWPKKAWGMAVALIVLAFAIPNFLPKYHKSVMSQYSSSNRLSQDDGQLPPAPAQAKKIPRPAVASATPLSSDAYSFSVRKGFEPESVLINPVGDQANQMGDEAQEEAQESAADNALDLKAPMIIRTADLAVKTDQFDKARVAVDEILKRHRGHVGELSVSNPTSEARSLTGTLRIPSTQLDVAIHDLKALGRVEKETQGGEEVTQQYVDLQARLANAKHTEQRLAEILRVRTGKLSDVLAVEVQISRVRGEIEQMEAQRKAMKNQVDFATLNLTVTEDYKKELTVAPPSTSTQFRNAAVDGYRSLVDGIIAVLLWLLSVGPTLLLWAAILFMPVRMVWKKVRAASARKADSTNLS